MMWWRRGRTGETRADGDRAGRQSCVVRWSACDKSATGRPAGPTVRGDRTAWPDRVGPRATGGLVLAWHVLGRGQWKATTFWRRQRRTRSQASAHHFAKAVCSSDSLRRRIWAWPFSSLSQNHYHQWRIQSPSPISSDFFFKQCMR